MTSRARARSVVRGRAIEIEVEGSPKLVGAVLGAVLGVRRVAVVGSRPGPREEFSIIAREVRALVGALPAGVVVVSGGAAGVDTIAAQTARARGLQVVEHLPDWAKHGRRAGILRNTTIVEDATEVHAFPSSWSRGTWDAIEKAKRAGKLAMVHGPFDPDDDDPRDYPDPDEPHDRDPGDWR